MLLYKVHHWFKLWEASWGTWTTSQYYCFAVHQREWEHRKSGYTHDMRECRRCSLLSAALDAQPLPRPEYRSWLYYHSHGCHGGGDEVQRVPIHLHTTKEVLFRLVDVYSTGLHAWYSQAITCVTPRNTHSRLSLRPALHQDDKSKIIKSHWDDDSGGVHIGSCTVPSHMPIDIGVQIYQMQDVQHASCDLAPAPAAELEASFLHHGLNHSHASLLSPLYSLLSRILTA